VRKISSPLRYPGGKSRALRKILPFIPPDFSEYREPLLGGGSVFIAVKQLHPKATYRINDLNHDLYCFWSNLKNNPNDLIDAIMEVKNNCKDGRKLYRKLTTDGISDGFCRAVRFYILNRITYSGTVDCGGYSSQAFERRFTISGIEKLRPLSDLLQDVKITNESYENPLCEDGENVFIYLDPPYWKSRRSKLYGRNGDLHTSFDHKRFSENMRRCRHRWLITYDDSDMIRALFAFANIYPWELQYGMNNVNGRKAKKGREIFLTNYVLSKTSGN